MSVSTVANYPVVIIKMGSASERDMQRTFKQVTQLTVGRGFVIYDCTDFHPNERQLARWIQVQAMGLRGSLSDGTTYTFLVGANDAVADSVERLEQETYGEVTVGLYDHMHEAVRHAEEGARIFSAW